MNPTVVNLFIWLFGMSLGILGGWAIVSGIENKYQTGLAPSVAKIVLGFLLVLLAVMLIAVGTIIQV